MLNYMVMLESSNNYARSNTDCGGEILYSCLAVFSGLYELFVFPMRDKNIGGKLISLFFFRIHTIVFNKNFFLPMQKYNSKSNY